MTVKIQTSVSLRTSLLVESLEQTREVKFVHLQNFFKDTEDEKNTDTHSLCCADCL